jgi:mRNA interferase HigB
VRIVSEKSIRTWAAKWPDAQPWLKSWLKAAERAEWTNLRDVRAAYPHADGVRVASGHAVTVFNVAGNKYRLVTSIHYNRGIVFTLLFLTHAEYSKDRWKENL